MNWQERAEAAEQEVERLRGDHSGNIRVALALGLREAAERENVKLREALASLSRLEAQQQQKACPRCEGSGGVPVEPPEEWNGEPILENCPKCEGSGSVCPMCRGERMITLPTESGANCYSAPCPTCQAQQSPGEPQQGHGWVTGTADMDAIEGQAWSDPGAQPTPPVECPKDCGAGAVEEAK